MSHDERDTDLRHRAERAEALVRRLANALQAHIDAESPHSTTVIVYAHWLEAMSALAAATAMHEAADIRDAYEGIQGVLGDRSPG